MIKAIHRVPSGMSPDPIPPLVLLCVLLPVAREIVRDLAAISHDVTRVLVEAHPLVVVALLVTAAIWYRRR